MSSDPAVTVRTGRSMRIAMVAACPFPWPRGTPIRIHRLAEALAARGHDVHVVTYHLGDLSMTLPFAVHRIRAVRGYRRHEPGPTLTKLLLLDPLLSAKLRRLLRSRPFDVIHAHHYEGLLAAVTARASKRVPPIIYDAHTLLRTELPHYPLGLGAGMTARLGRTLDRWLPARAQHVIAVTPEIRDTLVTDAAIAPGDVSIIPNGVECEHFAAAATPEAGAGDLKRLVFAGNLAPYQGIDLLLHTFELIRRRLPNARLQLLTDSDFGPYEHAALSSGIRVAIDVIRADYASLPQHLQRADVLLNPRVMGSGIPQKLLNYMASGRPIVSFAGSAKLLEHGYSALIVPNGDLDGFADAVVRLLAEPALGRALAANAQRLVQEQHSWEQVAARVETIYARLVPPG